MLSSQLAKLSDYNGYSQIITSTSNTLYLHFKTDGGTQRKGFKFYYTNLLILGEFMELHLTSNIEVDSLAVSHCAIIVNSEIILN